MMATPKAMCIVTIGYQHYLIPVADGLKVMSIMQKALSCEWTYGDSGKEVEAGAQPTLSMQMVSADQIRMPPGAAVTPATQSTQTTPKRIAKPPLRLNRKGD